MYKRYLLAFLLTSMLLLTIVPTVSPAQVNGTVIRVEPEEVPLGPPGEQFTIDIVLEDVANLIGWEFKLFWDNSILELISDVVYVPSGYNWDDPNNFQLGFGIEQDYSATHGRYHKALAAIRETQPHPIPFDGDTVLATLTFNVIGSGGTILDLQETKLSDPDANSISHVAEAGYVGTIIWIEPRSPTAYLGYDFVVDVMISVQASSMLVGVEFKVGFDGDILEGYPAIEGSFMKDQKWAPEGTFFNSSVEPPNAKYNTDYVITASVILPLPTTVFPEGVGTLATITFNGKAEGSGTITLFDTKMSDPNANSINHIVGDDVDVTVIEVTVSPDVNGDGDVDIFDIVSAAIAFGSYPGHPRFNPVADQNMDGIIDIFDIVTIALATEFGPALPRPELKIEPESLTVSTGSSVTVEVSISNVETSVKLVGIEFKVGFDSDILEGFPATEGTFMNNPAWAPDGTWFTSTVSSYKEDDWVITGTLILPEWTAFPEGGGTLATITFQGKAAGSGTITLYDIKLSDPNANPIKYIADDNTVSITVS